ncbi:MAG: hypothetical protein BGO26_13225 [Actinobacteria bacterium 69-20]|mgnify:CR=1 FL=1|jgi:DNA-binding SARP family transcriptional activator|nr:SARP family transcriptional regulator [Actinomycetota bacterium]OJV23632.1 MAG: hypothetical protein BGO26_13225 [Actinobacteria bacterium 69-20]
MRSVLASPDSGTRLRLLGGFTLTLCSDGTPPPIQHQAHRLIALLAIAGPADRLWAADILWPEVTEQSAHSRLRNVLWHTQTRAPGLITVAEHQLGLDPHLQIDVHDLRAAITAALDAVATRRQLGVLRDSGELLPGWYDDWVSAERETLRQRQINALERAATRLIAAHRAADAVALAQTAAALSPLRESAHRLIITAHLNLGNAAEAWHQYETYRTLLRRELAVPPSSQIRALIAPIHPARHEGGPNPPHRNLS